MFSVTHNKLLVNFSKYWRSVKVHTLLVRAKVQLLDFMKSVVNRYKVLYFKDSLLLISYFSLS